MRLKEPTRKDNSRTEKEKRLETFIKSRLERMSQSEPGADELLIVARSSDSPVINVLDRLLESSGGRINKARVVLLQDKHAETGLRSWESQLPLSVRLAEPHRFADAHEQLVIGLSDCWFGDCMRRDPNKRDAYEAYHEGDAEMARLARLSFSHLWDSATARAAS
jgi:hypothetical protein